MQAFITVWQIITMYNWEVVMYDGVRSWGGQKYAYFYFLFVLLIGVYILMNIFIIIILENFNERYADASSDGCLVAEKALTCKDPAYVAYHKAIHVFYPDYGVSGVTMHLNRWCADCAKHHIGTHNLLQREPVCVECASPNPDFGFLKESHARWCDDCVTAALHMATISSAEVSPGSRVKPGRRSGLGFADVTDPDATAVHYGRPKFADAVNLTLAKCDDCPAVGATYAQRHGRGKPGTMMEENVDFADPDLESTSAEEGIRCCGCLRKPSPGTSYHATAAAPEGESEIPGTPNLTAEGLPIPRKGCRGHCWPRIPTDGGCSRRR
jgi:hypothetical protein